MKTRLSIVLLVCLLCGMTWAVIVVVNPAVYLPSGTTTLSLPMPNYLALWYSWNVFTNANGDFVDSSGQNHMGRNAASPAAVLNNVPLGITLGGTNYATCSTNLPFICNGTTALTMSVWIKADATNWSNPGLLCYRGTYLEGINLSGQQIQFRKESSVVGGYTPSPWDTNLWHLLTCTYSSNNAVSSNRAMFFTYWDGNLVGSNLLGSVVTPMQQNDNLYMGWDDFDTSRRFIGNMDEVAVWTNHALSSNLQNQMWLDFKGTFGR